MSHISTHTRRQEQESCRYRTLSLSPSSRNHNHQFICTLLSVYLYDALCVLLVHSERARVSDRCYNLLAFNMRAHVVCVYFRIFGSLSFSRPLPSLFLGVCIFATAFFLVVYFAIVVLAVVYSLQFCCFSDRKCGNGN